MTDYNFTVRATDTGGLSADQSFSLTVTPAPYIVPQNIMAVDATDAYTSNDTTTWTKRTGMGGMACAYGNGIWLIVGTTQFTTGFGFRTSPDGVTYTSTVHNDPSNTLTNSAGTAIAWPTVTTSNAKVVSNLLFCHGYFYIIVKFTSPDLWIFRTADGTNWQGTNYGSGTQLPYSTGSAITVSNIVGSIFTLTSDGVDIFLNGTPTTGSTTLFGYTSTNPVASLTPVTRAAGTSSTCCLLTRNNGVYFAFSTVYTSGATASLSYYTSADGITWSTALKATGTTSTPASGYAGTYQPSRLFYVNGRFVVTYTKITSGSELINYTASSIDGINWTWAVTGNSPNTNSAQTYYTRTIFTNGVFIQVASNTPTATGTRISTNGGTSWTSGSASAFPSLGAYDIACIS